MYSFGIEPSLFPTLINLLILILFYFQQKMQQLRQTESTLHRRQAEHTAVLVAKDTAQQQAEQAETKVECLAFLFSLL